MQVIVLKPENFEEVSKKTGRPIRSLKKLYWENIAVNKLTYISIGAPWS